LSKSRSVVGQIVKYGTEENVVTNLESLPQSEKDKVFSRGYDKLCDIIYPSLSKEAQDARRKGEIGYLRIYDLCRIFKLFNSDQLIHDNA
jgi:hypothetical protein